MLSRGLLAEDAPGLFYATFAIPLQAIFEANRWPQATAYFEFHGPNSFAGQHAAEPHILIDVAIHRKERLLPGFFLALFGHLSHADVPHRGQLIPALRGSLEDGTLAGMLPEGVVARADRNVSPGQPLMFIHKSRAWLARLRERCSSEEELEPLR